MRTTLDIDDDVLQAAKRLAAMQKTSTGRALSKLARQALRPSDTAPALRNGVPLLLPNHSGECPVSLDQVNCLRESLDEGDPSEIETLWAREAEDRIAAFERGELEAIPGDEVFASLRLR